MLLGLDTGFFIGLRNKHPRVLQIWQEFIDGAHTLVVSTLTINEIFTYFYKRDAAELAQELLELMQISPEIELIPVSVEIGI